MALPSGGNFKGPTIGNSLSLLVKANDSTNLDGKLYEIYDNSGNALKVYGTYKIEDNKVHITYMKDQYGNEAPYDFYNLKYNNHFTFGTNSINSNIQNNIIKTDPYTFGSMPLMYYNSYNPTILNNYIGYNSSVSIFSNNIDLDMQNNIISNNCSIYMNAVKLQIYNNTIYNNNILYFSNPGSTKSLQNSIINSSNNIVIKSSQLNNIIINSSNNITLNNNASNVTILNNCNASVNLSNNIVVDNYISSDTLSTTPNSVYLFGQGVYAKSFNTLK